jgi:hypothetical protein
LLFPHLHCTTPALAGGARERSAARVVNFVSFVFKLLSSP